MNKQDIIKKASELALKQGAYNQKKLEAIVEAGEIEEGKWIAYTGVAGGNVQYLVREGDEVVCYRLDYSDDSHTETKRTPLAPQFETMLTYYAAHQSQVSTRMGSW